MRASTLWPLSVAGVLLVTVAANVVMLVLAGDPHASAVEPDYYARALAFDSTRAEALRSAALSWNAAAAIERGGGGAFVRVRLRDRDGHPVDGAKVRVVAIHNVEPDVRPEATLRGEGDGSYGAAMPLHRSGRWELRVLALRDGDRFEADFRVEAR